MSLFRGSSRFESLILSHHSRFTCECNKEEIDDDDDEGGGRRCAVDVVDGQEVVPYLDSGFRV